MSSLMYTVGYGSITASGSLTTAATVNKEGETNKGKLVATLATSTTSTLVFGQRNNVSAAEQVAEAKICIESMSNEQLEQLSSMLDERENQLGTMETGKAYTKKL